MIQYHLEKIILHKIRGVEFGSLFPDTQDDTPRIPIELSRVGVTGVKTFQN